MALRRRLCHVSCVGAGEPGTEQSVVGPDFSSITQAYTGLNYTAEGDMKTLTKIADSPSGVQYPLNR